MSDLRLRCSALPMAFLCGGSCRGDGVVIDEHNEAADIGSCVHAVMRDVIRHGLSELPDLRPYCVEFGIADQEQIGYLCFYGMQAWMEVRKHYPTPNAEYSLWFTEKDGAPIFGHADVVDFLDYKSAMVLDFKTGRDQSNFYHQMMGYCAGVKREAPDLETIMVQVVWLRDQVIRNFSVSAEDVDTWLEDFNREVVQWDHTFRPGGHCEHCPRFSNCPARRALVQATFSELNPGNIEAMAEVDTKALAPKFADMYPRVKVVESAIRRFRELLRNHVQEVGPLVLDDDKELRIVDEKRQVIDAKAAWPILCSELTEDELAGVVSISKTNMLKAVGAKAARGYKGTAKGEIMRRLEEAGAVNTTPRQSLRECKREDD